MPLNAVRQTDKYPSFRLNSAYNNKFADNGRLSAAQVSKLPEDGMDDGKISFANSSKHFLKGIISPITMLFESPKNLLTGVAMIAGGAALCSAFPPLLPLMIAIGVVTGTAQIAKGTVIAAKAKTDVQAEKAFEDIGSGSFAVVSSAIGAKGSLKAAGIEGAEKLNIVKATLRCFKEIPKGFSKSYQMVKNGTAWVSFKNTFVRPQNYADIDDLKMLKKAGYGPEKLAEIKAYSEVLHNEAMKQTYATVNPNKPYHPKNNPYREDSCINQFLEILPEELRDKVNFRVKSVSSIKDKVIRKICDKESTFKVDSIDDARALIGDLVGSCINLDNADDANIGIIVDSMADALRNGKIKFVKIDNYNGTTIEPYFSTSHIDTLTEASMTQNNVIQPSYGGNLLDVKSSKVKSSGYTTAQINIEYQNGAIGEFQIRGKEVNKIASVEHMPYDLRQNKDIAEANHLLKKLYSNVERCSKKLTKEGYAAYNRYLNALYSYYREIELGNNGAVMPKILNYMKAKPGTLVKHKRGQTLQDLQASLQEILSILKIENLEQVKSQSTWLKTIPPIKYTKLIQQNALAYAGVENFINDKNT